MCNSKTALRTARESQYVISRFFYCVFSLADEWSMDFVVLNSYFYNNTQPLCLSQASVFKIYCPLLFRWVSAGGLMSYSLSFFRVICSTLVRFPNPTTFLFQKPFKIGEAVPPNLRMNLLNTLQTKRKDLNLVTVASTCILWMASSVWLATSSFPCLIIWPRYSIHLVQMYTSLLQRRLRLPSVDEVPTLYVGYALSECSRI